jgi:CRISPR/Cas system-associated exonuclease Cas4 (RecB family)
MIRVVTSTSAAARADAAREFLAAQPPAAEVTIVGASRGAADDLARSVAVRAGATFGWTRFSFTELAARAVADSPGARRHSPGSQAGTEAIAARAVFEARSQNEIGYFEPVSSLPGFPRALARTLYELRLSFVDASRLDERSPATLDLGRLLVRFEDALARAGVDDRAALFRSAARLCREGHVRWARQPTILLDVPLDSAAEQTLAAALAYSSARLLATVPAGDTVALHTLAALGAEIEHRPDDAVSGSDLASLRRYIFDKERPPERRHAGDVSLFSAPGEGREAVEIVRRILEEAAGGVRFDEIAVFLRTPQQYLGVLENACARGQVPAFFDRGTHRPDPAGRAFIALLSCAVDGLSAKRFDEYLSLGQVPQVGEAPATDLVVPDDEALATWAGGSHAERERGWGAASSDKRLRPERGGEAGRGGTDGFTAEPVDSDDEAVVAGTLRSPWKWEELIVESAVVGGRTRADGQARWRRRLDGLRADYLYRIGALEKEEPESARIARYRRDLRNLAHLREFALPIVDRLAGWPDQATWGEWLDRFATLARAALRRPTRVLQVLADLRPMSAIGPVGLEEARDVLHDRLVTLDREPPASRYGRVFVGTPHQARGRSFRIVFVPGLAERVVPQRPREDPLLLDDNRKAVDPMLIRIEHRVVAERLLLRIALGAARERLYLSYPRLDVSETRARVPSFYALDVMRAITGRVPDHRVLASDAAEAGGASLAWPAPADPDRAIDDMEHDLAVLRPLLEARDATAVKGHAHYLLGLNEALRRSVISRWSRGRSAWSTGDGLIRVAPGTSAALAAHRLNRRPYSLSALQRFATCPYQFLLATIHRLEPWDEPEPLVRMDPLTRGSLFHRAQAEFFREMQADDALPIRPERVADAKQKLDAVLDRVASEYEETLVPAIPRVWRDEIDELRRDLNIWVQRIAVEQEWRPAYFEFSFGLTTDEGRDPRSLPNPITIEGGFVLRGSVDLIEEHAALPVLRVTDHKTGRNRTTADLIVGGGTMLQPVLYSVAVEQGLGRRVIEGRLFYATTTGGFFAKLIPINDYTRGQGQQVLEIVDRAVERGTLPAAPSERACTWCDFRPVCGPREEERTARKSAALLADLAALRSMR